VVRSLATAALLGAAAPLCWAPQYVPAAIEDAIDMTRIQPSVAPDGSIGAFSPDGTRFAAVVWTGDLKLDANVYTLLLFEVHDSRVGTGRKIVEVAFRGDPSDAEASPIEQVEFSGNRTIFFIGRMANGSAQVYTVNCDTGVVRQVSHSPTPVRSFVIGKGGRLSTYSAVAESDSEHDRQATLSRDGVFLWDDTIFDQRTIAFKAYPALRMQPRLVRQYFLAGAAPRLIFDSRQSRTGTPLDLRDPEVTSAPTLELHEEATFSRWASLTGDPSHQYALLFPYALGDHPMHPERYAYYKSMNAYARRVAAPYGLVDLKTGKIERLIDAPHPQFDQLNGGGPPVWSPDGESVLVYTLSPPETNLSEDREKSNLLPGWYEVSIPGRASQRLNVPIGWRVLRWNSAGKALVLSKGAEFALLTKTATGKWGGLTSLGSVPGLNTQIAAATNGRLVIGVREAPSEPPELAAYDYVTGRAHPITNLNPALRERHYGATEEIHWASKYDDDASGLLVKPTEYRPGTLYPLVLLLDDGTLGQEGEPFLIDAALQLSGYAIQALADNGFVVLYAREPKSLRRVIGTHDEGEHMREHVESAVAVLVRRGLIDPARVGLSGWSRAAYYTNYTLIHSSMPFAAAAQIDGGGLEYTEGTRPFSDLELTRIRTPILFEAHGLFSLILSTAMADRLDALRKPTEILYFAGASHQTTQPRQRLRSLTVNVDWWRFWLKDETDPSAEKKRQYDQWRALRPMQAQVTTDRSPSP
jgi:dipeptidyl aminopeptidase/acylaminoacyl peptidase